VAWVRARRATWSDDPPSDIDHDPRPPRVVTPSAPPLPDDPVVHGASADDVPVRPAVKPEAAAGRFTINTLPLDVERLVRWSGRAGVVAGLLAIVVGGGWFARTYWLKLAASPKTSTAVLTSVPAAPELRDRRRGRTGRLLVASEPAGARVLVDGRVRGVTPLTIDDLSVGSHLVVLDGNNGSVRRTVVVTSERAARITESIYSGWLKVFAPFELEITEDTRGIRLDERNQALLPPGPHNLWFENRALGYRETRHVEIEPGATASLSLDPPPSTLTVTATLPSGVRIDGEQVGDTPLTDHLVRLGTHDVIVTNAAAAERRFSITVTVKPVRLDVDFSKP